MNLQSYAVAIALPSGEERSKLENIELQRRSSNNKQQDELKFMDYFVIVAEGFEL
jgi:hypothetical protein